MKEIPQFDIFLHSSDKWCSSAIHLPHFRQKKVRKGNQGVGWWPGGGGRGKKGIFAFLSQRG